MDRGGVNDLAPEQQEEGGGTSCLAEFTHVTLAPEGAQPVSCTKMVTQTCELTYSCRFYFLISNLVN